ncbi:MAG: YcaO-like family protein [Thermoleophilaceae bacterium]|nr:YcaO-like family protein [Thermoleophilaceae bacterium]
MSARSLDPRWLAGVMTLGILCVGPEDEVRVDLEGRFEVRKGLVELLAAGATPQAVAALTGVAEEEAAGLLDELESAGALRRGTALSLPELSSLPLAEAIRRSARGEAVRLAHTSEELLVLPEGIAAAAARQAVRGFVAGIDPPGRRAVYSYLAIWREHSTVGDVPDAAQVAEALERLAGLDGHSLHVFDLLRGGVSSLPAAALFELDCSAPHRLGPLLELRAPEPMAGGQLQLVSARYASPNLRAIGTPYEDWARGMARDAERATVMARAESAERFASGEVSRAPLVRARERDLPNVLPTAELYTLNERQLETATWCRRYDPEAVHHWLPGVAADGARQWVIADAVHYPFPDPNVEAPPVVAASSNGVAAYSSYAGARERALRELVERDAIMWTWLQGITRELLEVTTLPEDVQAHIAQVARDDGLTTALVNLTLDTDPVILCAMHGEADLRLGASCDPDPVQAARKAVLEADGIRYSTHIEEDPPTELTQVERPKDHLLLHLQPEQLEADRFLFGSDERVDAREVLGADAPLEESVRAIGEPVFVDLTCVPARPFHVVRALVPGLLPISFGYDREPLGMPRLAESKRLPDGRVLGRELDIVRSGPYVPHPFP